MCKFRRIALAGTLILLAFAAIGRLQGGQTADSPASGAAAHGVDVTIMDKTCKPCEDFYHYASGVWLARNPIPPAYPAWGRFTELAERNRELLHQILETAAANNKLTPGTNEQKIGDFYASCMDEKTVDAAGAKPLGPEFARIDGIQNLKLLQDEIARLQELGVRAAFDFGSTQDLKNTTQVIGNADQGGIGLPDRDYYTKTDDHSKDIREKYEQHVAKMLALAGEDNAKASAGAKAVMDLETRLAEASMTRVERRDPDKTYHKMNRAAMQALTPDWSWDSYFQEIGYANIDTVDVSAPKFFEAMDVSLKAAPLETWKIYLRWHLLDSMAPYLTSPFVDEDFNFKGRVLQGTQELLPRWKRCVSATDRRLGEALGQFYVQKYFPPQAKARALELVNNLRDALRDDLQTLPWMSPDTRKQALTKLDAFTRKIGYPDKWRDYSAYRVDRASYVLNQMRGGEFNFKRELNKIGKPVERAEWDMSPPTVNAYYNPTMNEIVFPAGILQPPFFDPNADDASNYGGIGAVIGHEMTHGFDDQGRKFDAQGNLRNWWTPEDEKNFTERALCVEKQFDGYVVEDDLHENGKLELGEAIADLGGLNIAYRALKKAEKQKGTAPSAIGGLTPDQRFFLAFAQVWASNGRPEYDRLLVNTDAHPLPRFRGIASPSNMPEFASAFECKAGDPMARPAGERCVIW